MKFVLLLIRIDYLGGKNMLRPKITVRTGKI